MMFLLGFGESNHFQEIPAETIESLYVLFGVLIELTESRGIEKPLHLRSLLRN